MQKNSSPTPSSLPFRPLKPEKGDSPGIIIYAAVGLALCGIMLMFAMILIAAAKALFQPDAPTPWSWVWQPYNGQFGILPMATGSLFLALFAMTLGWPIAICITIWRLCEDNKAIMPMARFCGAVIRFMSAIPTVVYGFAAVFLLSPTVRNMIGGSGMCFLSAAIMLVFLVLPSITLVLETGFAPRLTKLCPWGLALGFSRLQLLRYFVLPLGKRTFVAAFLLGFGRALGDTLIPLMLAGNAPAIFSGLNAGIRPLTSHMALVTANEVGGAAFNSLFLAGFILLLTNAGASLLMRKLEARAK